MRISPVKQHHFINRKVIFLASIILIYNSISCCALSAADGKCLVELVTEDAALGPSAKYGLERLTAALAKHKLSFEKDAGASANSNLFIVGTYQGSEKIKNLVEGGSLKLDKTKESLLVKHQNVGNAILYIIGYDDVGLMYALLDIADKIEHSADASNWFAEIQDISESPRNEMRRMRVMMHHAANEKEWYHSEAYWDWYIGMLAANRFNGLNLVYSHQTPYMAPMYAWHVKLDEFPNVKPIGVTEEELEQNRKVMRLIAKLCHERGIELTIGVWQHLPWVNSYLGSRPDQEHLIEGLNGDNIGPYTYKAMQKLLKECPGIARIQLRPNDESGIHPKFQTEFYRDYVVKAIKDSGTGVKVDLRTVGVQNSTIKAVRDADLDMRNSFKFYGEMLGQPYTMREELTSGYSFSQYLKKPLPNPMYNEVWVIGSHRVLLWGSEDYGRRFGRNASYGGTIGFETDGPHAQMGYLAPSTPAWRMFKNKADEYFTHEIERYWGFFRTIGRFSYNPDAPREVWLRPFKQRFGDAAEPMAAAYESASRVMGLIVSSHLENPNFYTWPEISMGGLIPYYNEIKGMDKGLFPSIDDQVDDELAGRLTGRLGPERLAALFEKIADQIDKSIAVADTKVKSPSKEYRSTVKDFQILAHLARYHAHRQREGYNMAKYYRTSDASLLPAALVESEKSVEEWNRLLEIANPTYYEHLQTGQIENGHWKDKRFLIETNPKIVREAIENLHTHGIFDWGFDFDRTALNRQVKVFSGFKIYNCYFYEPRFTGIGPNQLYNPRVGYGFLDNKNLEATHHPMELPNNLAGAAPKPGTPLPLDLLRGDFIHSKRAISFRTDLPMDDYRFTFVFADRSARPTDHGPFELRDDFGEEGGVFFTNIQVPAGKTVYRQVNRHIRRHGWDPYLIFSLVPSKEVEGADAMIAGLTIHKQAPKLAHAPPRCISPASPAPLSVTITMPPQPVNENGAGPETSDQATLSAAPGNRLAGATLFYRTDESQEYHSTPLVSQDGFVFSASLDPAKLEGRWLEYFFTATDKAGRNGQIPEMPETKPFRARLTTDTSPPVIEHIAIKECEPGKPLSISARVHDPDGVAIVRVYYRRMDATIPYEFVALSRQGDKYVGTIPGEAIQKDWEFMYYLEAVDEAGTGCYAPDWEKDIAYYLVNVKR
jgi:hypothetical protein